MADDAVTLQQQEHSKETQETSTSGGAQRKMDATSTKSTTDPNQDGLASKVAAHYNTLPEAGKAKRVESRIFFQRNFNNWIKSVCIGDALKRLKDQDASRKVVALDLCCGKGGDLLKWKRGNIGHLVCADIAGVSVEQCEQRYHDLQRRNRNDRFPVFTAEFYTADCAAQRLAELYKNKNMTFDLTSCQFSFHYSFESIQRVDMMLRNACERLRPGGLFVGTIPNGCELVRRVKNSEGLSFGNDVYSVTFKNKDAFPLFGCIYDFHLEGVVDCPEFLVYFPLLEKMAKKYGMRLLYSETFAEFFKRHSIDRDNNQLLGRMKALEVYPPPDGSSVVSQTEGDYDHALKYIESKKSNGEDQNIRVGTLSKAEWDATSIYLVYAFIKEDPSNPSETEETGRGHQGEPEVKSCGREEGMREEEAAAEGLAKESREGVPAASNLDEPEVKRSRREQEGEREVASAVEGLTAEEITEAERAVQGLNEQPT